MIDKGHQTICIGIESSECWTLSLTKLKKLYICELLIIIIIKNRTNMNAITGDMLMLISDFLDTNILTKLCKKYHSILGYKIIRMKEFASFMPNLEGNIFRYVKNLTVELNYKNLRDNDLKIFSALQYLYYVEHLRIHLAYNYIKDGLIYLRLPEKKKLDTFFLDASQNQIGDVPTDVLDDLWGNKCLQNIHMDFKYNNLTPKKIQKLMETKNIPSLKYFHLDVLYNGLHQNFPNIPTNKGNRDNVNLEMFTYKTSCGENLSFTEFDRIKMLNIKLFATKKIESLMQNIVHTINITGVKNAVLDLHYNSDDLQILDNLRNINGLTSLILLAYGYATRNLFGLIDDCCKINNLTYLQIDISLTSIVMDHDYKKIQNNTIEIFVLNITGCNLNDSFFKNLMFLQNFKKLRVLKLYMGSSNSSYKGLFWLSMILDRIHLDELILDVSFNKLNVFGNVLLMNIEKNNKIKKKIIYNME